jgi:DNA-binding response OmpR family regulator
MSAKLGSDVKEMQGCEAMNRTILLVEDEPKMRQLLVDYLSLEGYSLVQAANGPDALKLFRETQVDLIILDIMIPFIDGFAVCKAIRAQSDVMIVMLTAKSQEEDKLVGYDFGADDYITKPFSPKVLVAKINALFKRLEASAGNLSNSQTGIIRINGLLINELANEVKLEEEIIALSPKEYELLLHLYKNRNRTLSRDMLLDQVWGVDYYGDVRTVDTHIKRLRQKLRHKADLIITVKGFGYKFRGDV